MSFLPTFLTFLPARSECRAPCPLLPIPCSNPIWTQSGVLALGSQHMPCTWKLAACRPQPPVGGWGTRQHSHCRLGSSVRRGRG